MNVVLLEPSEVADTADVQISGSRAVHVTTVLKATVGSTVRVGIVNGPLGDGRVTHVEDGSVRLECTFGPAPPPRPAVDLLLALPRPKVLKRLWAQLSALGVDRIMLTNAARVERNYFDTHVLEPTVYRPLLIDGLQQARDTQVPRVTVHRQLKVFIEDELGPPDGLRLIAHPTTPLTTATAVTDAPASRVLIAVGPEGGWSDYERQLLERHEFIGVSMGARTLRSDTACIALLTLVHDALRRS